MKPVDVLAAAAAEIRRQALDEARARIMSLAPDVSALAPEHRTGFRSGHVAARHAARDIITDMLAE